MIPFEAFFGLTGTPFARIFLSTSYWRQQAAKNYTAGSTMWHGHVLSVSLPVTLEREKTTAIRKFSQGLDINCYQVLYISDSALTPETSIGRPCTS